jgi:hypothetical protein
MQLLYFALGLICGFIAVWLLNMQIDPKLNPSDLLDSLVTLLVGLFITRKVADSQNTMTKQLSEQQQKTQVISANLRVEKDIVIEQLRGHLVKFESVSNLIEQYRYKTLSTEMRNEMAITFRNLNISLRDIQEMLQGYQIPISSESLETLLKQQHEFSKTFTSREFEAYSVDGYLQAREQYRKLILGIHRLIHTINTL